MAAVAMSVTALRSSSLSFAAVSNRARISAGIVLAASRTAFSACVICSNGTGSNRLAVSASRTMICCGTETAPNCGCHQRPLIAVMKACAKSQFNRSVIVSERADGLFIFPDARSRHGFHRANNRLKVTGGLDLAAQTRGGIAHDFSVVGKFTLHPL